MDKIKWIFFISITLLLVGCNKEKFPNKLVFATSAEYPPFEFIREGKIQGYDIELAELIAKELGKDIEFKNMQFSAILPALESHSVDAAIATLTITPQRQQQFDFSDPYYHESLSIVYKNNFPLQTQEALVGNKIAVQLGTTMEIWLKARGPIDIVPFDNNNLAIEALKAGHVSGVLMDSVQAMIFSHQNKQYGLSHNLMAQSDTGYGVALPKNSILYEPLNQALQSLVAKGELARLKDKWLDKETALKTFNKKDSIWSMALFIGKGIVVTLELLIGAIVIGIVLGTVFAIVVYKGVGKSFFRVERVSALIVNRIISILRGTPLLLQLSLIYFSVPLFFDIKLTALQAGVITFGLNSSAYVSEILRAGIASLPKGQFEAAKTLQIPTYYMWKDIILPQVIRNVLPAMINEVIALLKETALIAIIGGLDLMRSAQLIVAENFNYFAPLCIAGVYYYVLVLCIEYVGKKIEKRGKYA